MKTPWIAAALLTCCSTLMFGQSVVRISGRVVDPIGEGVSANLTLTSDSGESISAASSAQSNGSFTVAPVWPGTYQLVVDAPGFRKRTVAVEALAGKDVNVGTIWVAVSPIEGDDVIEVPTSTPIDATVCEILKDPLRFHSRIVRVRAEAYSDIIDMPPILFDRNCRGSIVLNLPSTGSILNDWSYRTLYSNIHSLFNPSTAVTIEGKFTYVLQIAERNMMYLNVETVSDVVPVTGRR